ncbi:MAG: hypothetical protein WBB42_12735 [Polyangiales bacterium]
MKRTLRVPPDAEVELESAAMWYEEKRRGLGIEFAAVAHTKRRPGYWLDRQP